MDTNPYTIQHQPSGDEAEAETHDAAVVAAQTLLADNDHVGTSRIWFEGRVSAIVFPTGRTADLTASDVIGPMQDALDEWQDPPPAPWENVVPIFRCADPEGDWISEMKNAYALSDPKHPDHHSLHVDLYDTYREGK